MIKSIDIKNFGSFSEFDWETQVKNEKNNVVEFKKLNILYGRNYSGKTTLSRLVRCLETEELPKKYNAPDFNIETTSGTISSSNIETSTDHVRVFNSDFVDDHLSFLRNDVEGLIEPFAVLGGDNTKITKKVSNLEVQLGSVDSKTGLRYDHSEKSRKSKEKSEESRKATKNKEKLLKEKAKEIKQKTQLYDKVNYDITRIRADINLINSSKADISLAPEERVEINQLLKQNPLPAPTQASELNLKLEGYYKLAEKLLLKEIKPTDAIQELLDDALLQAWAKSGIALHAKKRSTCGFCGNPIPEALWKKLDSHFSKESTDLDKSISELIINIQDEVTRIGTLYDSKKSDFYSTLHQRHEEIEIEIQTAIKSYTSELNRIEKELKMAIRKIL